MAKKYSSDQLLDRWEDLREIKNLMGRMSADYCLKQEGEMYDRYWSQRDDVSLGVNEGWYVGTEAIRGYYATLDSIVEAQSAIIAEIFPDKLGGKTAEELHGVGTMDYRPVDTPVVEIAGDGKTAKGIWCIRGSRTEITTAGPVAYWEWGWFAGDFVRENGVWKIWHLQYLQEVFRPNGSKWHGEEKKFKDKPEFAKIAELEMVKPNVPATVRERYHTNRRFTPSPRVPEPYETFSETFSYGVPQEVAK